MTPRDKLGLAEIENDALWKRNAELIREIASVRAVNRELSSEIDRLVDRDLARLRDKA